MFSVYEQIFSLAPKAVFFFKLLIGMKPFAAYRLLTDPYAVTLVFVLFQMDIKHCFPNGQLCMKNANWYSCTCVNSV